MENEYTELNWLAILHKYHVFFFFNQTTFDILVWYLFYLFSWFWLKFNTFLELLIFVALYLPVN